MLNILFIREMKIKMTLRYCLIPVRIDKNKISDDSQGWRRGKVKGHSCIVGDRANFYSHFGINQLQDLAIPLLGIYPKDTQSYHKDFCSTMFISALFIIART